MDSTVTTTSPELRLGRQKTKPSMSGSLIATAIKDAFVKLDPRTLMRNPVMFGSRSCPC
jgi:hypothetical protein